MKSFGKGLTITSDTLTPGLKAFPEKLDRAVAQVADFYEPQVESYAKRNAPWTDRTANARNGLRAKAEHIPSKSHSIWITHGVPYGIWLEVKNEGEFGIIVDTIKSMGIVVMGTVRNVFARMS